MKFSNDSNKKLHESIIHRAQQERITHASDASAILSKLNVSIENLPQKCQQLLQEVSTAQAAAQVEQLDLVSLTLCPTRQVLDKLDDDYEILKLKQKNKELQAKIDRNSKVIEQLKQDLAQSRASLSKQNPNPDNVEEYCRQMRQKVTSYDENCQRAKAKYSSLSVPASSTPESLVSLAASLASLTESATSLRHRADDVTLAIKARDALRQLRK